MLYDNVCRLLRGRVCCRKIGQRACKPGSVCPAVRGCLPFIHDQCYHWPLSFYPPARAGRPLLWSPVYMNFQLPGCTAPVSPLAWWALAPPSHPYPACAWRLFSSTSTGPCEPLSVRKRDALCCPDFPLASRALGVWASGRPACCPVIMGKGTKKNHSSLWLTAKSCFCHPRQALPGASLLCCSGPVMGGATARSATCVPGPMTHCGPCQATAWVRREGM